MSQNPPIAVITEHPAPSTDAEMKALWEHNEQLQREHDTAPHPDEFHERYIAEIESTDVWTAFRIYLYGFGGYVHLRNNYGGYGLRVSTMESELETLAELFVELHDSEY